VLVAELRGIGDDKIATIIAGQRHRPASGDGSNFQQTLNASSRQSRRVSDGLSQHCIQLRLWELIDGKKPTTVKTSGTALVTDPTEALSLALAGVGIAYIAEPLARRYVREGSLELWSFRLACDVPTFPPRPEPAIEAAIWGCLAIERHGP